MEVEGNETRRRGIERRTRMLQHTVQQERQTCVLLENMQHFIQEISTLRSLTEVAGVAGSLLAELDAFKHEVEYIERLLYNTSSLSFTSSLSQVFIAFSYGLLNVEDLISEGIKLLDTAIGNLLLRICVRNAFRNDTETSA